MSNDHEANRKAAQAAMGVSSDAFHTLPAPTQLNAGTAHRGDAATAAPNPPALPHGGIGALRELGDIARGVVGDIASDVRDLFRRVPAPRPLLGPQGEALPAPRVLPSFLRSVKLSGGAETLGIKLRDVEHLVPSFVTSTGDLTVEIVAPTAAHALPPPHLLARILGARSRTPALEPETRPEIVARLTAEANAETAALRDFVSAEVHAGRITFADAETLRSYVAEKLRRDVQDLRLDPAEAARAFVRSWRAPAARRGPLGTPYFEYHDGVSPMTFLLKQFGLDATSLATMAGRFARSEEWLLEGRAHERAVEEHDSAARAHASAKASTEERERHLDAVHVVTPKSAGLIFARRVVNAANTRLAHGVKPTEIRYGNHEYIIGRRHWPACVSMPTTTAALMIAGVDVGFEILGDDAELSVTERMLEHGRTSRTPRWVLSRVLTAARVRVGMSTPTPIADFCNMRDRTEARRRMAIFRAHLELVADSFGPGAYPDTASIDQMVAHHFAVVALRLDPALAANELAKRMPGADVSELSERGFAIARSPATWIFRPDESVGTE